MKWMKFSVWSIAFLAAFAAMAVFLPISFAISGDSANFTQIWKSDNVGFILSLETDDLDGDGIVEIIAGTFSDFNSNSYHGNIYIFDGATHEQKWKSDDIGRVDKIVISDLDGDGKKEIIAKVQHGESATIGDRYGYVYVFDGATHEQKWKSEDVGGLGDLVIGDLNGDNVREIIVSGQYSYSCSRDGRIYVFDGADFTRKWRSENVNAVEAIAVEDVDDDGTKEIVAGNFISDCADYPGNLYVFNGINFTQEWKSDDIGRVRSVIIEDADDDGIKEIIAATARLSGPYSGYVQVFDGRTHNLEWKSLNIGHPGRLKLNDIDGDGTKEIITKSVYVAPRVYIFDAKDHDIEWTSEELDNSFDLEVNDVDTDGVKEVLAVEKGDLNIFNGITHDREWQSEDIDGDQFAVSDLGGDGRKEIIISSHDNACSASDCPDRYYTGYLYIFAQLAANQPPTTFDDFNSYADGDLNDQGCWSGNAAFDIQRTTVYEGAKAVYISNDGLSLTISKSGTSQTDGRMSVYMRRDYVGQGDSYFSIKKSGEEQPAFAIVLSHTGNIYGHYGNSPDPYYPFIFLGSWNLNTWYLLEIEWRSSDHKGRYRINNGTWTDWLTSYPPENPWSSGGLDTVMLQNNYRGDVYYDFIEGEIENKAPSTCKIEDKTPPITSNVTATPNPATVNTSILLNAMVSDATTGGSPIISTEYRIDNGPFIEMTAQDGAFNEVTENVIATIGAFAEAGVHNICVRGTDSAGNTGAEECILLAVYDPNAGFVTGGGWINSPEGAYIANTSLTGKANFGFVSKYQKGANVPTGQTEFQFKVANLNFHSSAYLWLVIAGAKAQYKGTGTINGMGNYGFMLTAIDGQINGVNSINGSVDESDRFRIKIWNKLTDSIIYDNQIGDSDISDPTTAIVGGNIIIHK